MKFATAPAPHTVASVSVRRTMTLVVGALVPTVIAHVIWFGFGIVINILLATCSALIAEAIALKLRGRTIRPFITDGSAVLTAMLMTLALPPLTPWWMTVSGAAFAILVAKHLYGGLGYNLFNPAMVGYAALLVSFPWHMTHWLAPAGLGTVDLSFAATWHTIFAGELPKELSWDAVSGATPLTSMRSGLILRNTLDEIQSQPIFGNFAGRGFEWIALATLLGGVVLLITRTIRWQIPCSMLGAIFLCALIMHALDPGANAGPTLHVFGGASMLGAFFIATDPVTAATSNQGRIIYGAGIGLLTYVIRSFGGYPDGVAFSVLLMNAAVPLIDRYTVPRIYGHSS
jgi:electron transport complex protein RnfD